MPIPAKVCTVCLFACIRAGVVNYPQKGVIFMHEYEVLIETINPCGGEAHANKEFKEIEAESPEAYVLAQGHYPILDSGKNASGDTVITTGDGKGRMIRYTFTT